MAAVDDPPRLTYGTAAAGVGGAVLVVSLFLDWFFGANAFQSFDVVDIVLLAIGLAAVALAAVDATRSALRLPFARVAALRVLGIVATTLVLEVVFEGTDQEGGTWLGLIGALAILGGALTAARAPALAPGRLAVPAPPPPPPPEPVDPPPPGEAADWYADPRGQKRLRYWDGKHWTDHTAD